jgi:diguanylate cyclase (GGDEF)-like protein/PAS domain S-box-containing protein
MFVISEKFSMKKEIRILIIDDDKLIRVAVKRTLEKSGHDFKVDEASDSASISNMLQSKRFDCIIVDFFLTDTTGLDVIKKLIELRINTPVIMLTGQGDELVAVKAMKAGAYDYLPKSILSHNDAAEILSYTMLNAINSYKSRIEQERMTIALRKSEERYRSLVEHSPMLIIRFFPDDKSISFVNDGFCAYFNTTRAEVIGESIYKYILGESQETDIDIDSLNIENPVVSFNNYSKTDKGIIWQIWTLQALFDRFGKLLEYQCIGEDITPIKRAEKDIYNQKLYFQSILDSQENMIIVTDKKKIIEANHSFLIFFGYRNLDDFKSEHSDIIELALDIPGYITNNGKSHWIDSILNDSCSQKLAAFRPENTKPAKIFSININILSIEEGEVYVATFSDVTELERKSKTFEEKASNDALTGIYNKDKFYEILSSEVELAKKYKNDLSVIFFDIDHFKKINDTYGHQVGDNVLHELVQITKTCMRKSDIFSRWGGEEFIVLLPQIDIDDALQVGEKFRKKIMQYNFNEVQHVTCSFGVTTLSENDTVEKLVKRADKALYKAKETGRNRVVGIKSNQ